jgi:hypothetical protein
VKRGRGAIVGCVAGIVKMQGFAKGLCGGWGQVAELLGLGKVTFRVRAAVIL